MELQVIDESKHVWHVKFKGAALYDGEVYTLQFRFVDRYPFEAPEVKFVG